MPEATMDKQRYAVSWENEVWFPGKVFTVKPEAKSHPMR